MSVLIGGFAASQMLYVAARLKLADLLAGGPMTIADLARECGAKEVPLRRVVRGLAAFGVFEIQEDGRFANNWLSECLRSGAQDSVREMALLYGEEHYHAMSELLQAVRRGGTAFEHAYRQRMRLFKGCPVICGDAARHEMIVLRFHQQHIPPESGTRGERTIL